MAKTARLRAEQQFAATQKKKKDKQVLKEREKAERERAEHRAYLRGLRLAKEAADKAAAAETAKMPAKKSVKKSVAGVSSADSDSPPQAHRRSA